MMRRLALTLSAFLLLLSATPERAAANAFYEASKAELAGPPGSLIRIEPWPIQSVYKAKVYRILYRSRGLHGEPIAVSGSLTIPDFPAPSTGRGIVAWAHGTSGVARSCAPSLRDVPYHSIPGIQDMLAEGYVVVATDYPGLGTAGVHPYLVGESAARAVLDSVRAVRQVPEAQASAEYVVWGHSQGGHAALWTGQIAHHYAPDIHLHGVAAAAPATELGRLLDADETEDAGKILTAFAIWSWSRVFGAPEAQIVRPGAAAAVEKVAADCIDITGQALNAVQVAGSMGDFLTADPTETQPWKGIMDKNTPGGSKIGVPVFIAQGMADTIVRPKITVDFVRQLCSQGEHVTFIEMQGVDHGMAARKSERRAVDWMRLRLGGQAVPSNC